MMMMITCYTAHTERESGRLGGSASGCGLLLDGQEQFELRGQFLLGVQAIREVNAADATIGVQLDSKGLNVIRAVRAACEVAQVELNLVPAFVQSHGHSADEGFYARRGLLTGSKGVNTGRKTLR
jgi:hypothetical protein